MQMVYGTVNVIGMCKHECYMEVELLMLHGSVIEGSSSGIMKNKKQQKVTEEQ